MPLISVMIPTFNQEAYVRETVMSCLRLEGGPFDIVIADDASTDRTPEIVRACLDAYDGPHTVTFHAQPSNVGVLRNIEQATSLCRGDYILGCGGDDVVMPDRAVETIRLIGEADNVAAVVCSATVISATGETQATIDLRPGFISPLQMVAHGGGVAVGPCYTYRRDCLQEYFHTPSNLAAEDRVIPLLCSLRGKVVATDQRLLKYRKHHASLTYTGTRRYLHPFENPHHMDFMREQCAAYGQLSPAVRCVLALKSLRYAKADGPVSRLAALADRVFGRLAGLAVMQTRKA
jgi:glycosyltransferase involved in cell wall biosynthesis